MEYTRLKYEKQDRVAIVTFSRPKSRNAWSMIMHDELLDLFPKIENDPEVLCVILTGDQAGRAFCAGADLADVHTHTPASVADEISHFTPRGMEIFNMFQDFPKPIVCAINGYSVGIGFQIPLCCDIIIASENAEMGLPQVGLGILPAYGGALRLARFVGKGHAMRMTLMAKRITAREAYRIGLVTEVVPLPQLMDKAMEIAKHIASLPPLSVRMAKESLNMSMDICNVKEAAQADLYRFMALSMTEDKTEGHSSWREKRKPVFKGK